MEAVMTAKQTLLEGLRLLLSNTAFRKKKLFNEKNRIGSSTYPVRSLLSIDHKERKLRSVDE